MTGIIIQDHVMCTGCGACTSICPVSCISMEQDEEGFLYPFIDERQCIKCGKCDQVCPVGDSPQKNKPSYHKGYVAYVKDDAVRVRSASGGIFSALAGRVLREGGIVYGAAFDEDFQVHHIGVSSEKDIDLLRRSKYVQSRTENTFQEMESVLEKGQIVLYTGTPCQIAGLKAYLGRDYEKLYTADLICYGVPSPALWKRYLKEIKDTYSDESDSLRSISFRSKVLGWKYTMEINFKNGSTYLNEHDRFNRLFLSGICLRKSCYQCQYRTLERISDITLGDAWRIDKYFPHMNDGRGVSNVLLHTEKGERLFENIRDGLVAREVEADFFRKTQRLSGEQRKINPKRKQYLECFLAGASIEELEKLVRPSLREKSIVMVKKSARKLLGDSMYERIKDYVK